MSQKRQVSIIVKKPDFRKAMFMDFEVEREGWNEYRLEDGTLLRAKLVFSGFLADEDIEKLARKAKPGEGLKIGFGLRYATVYGVESPPELRGTPDPTKYSKDQLQASIVKEVDFETTKAVWNSYLLKNKMSIRARLSLVSISRTTKFDGSGMPVYWVDSAIDLKFALPDHVEEILTKKIEVKKKQETAIKGTSSKRKRKRKLSPLS